jgi:hypothetical protein
MPSLGISTSVAEVTLGDIFLTIEEAPQIDISILNGAGKTYTRGTILGKITSTSEYIKWDNRTSGAATDGSQIPVGVLLTDTDASVTTQKATIAIAGEFDLAKLTARTTILASVYNTLGTIIIKEKVA